MTADELDRLRARIRSLDGEIIALVAERVALARQVGERKQAQGLSTIDYAQERDVLDRARARAESGGLDPGVAEELFAGLIRASVSAQEADRVRMSAVGAGKRAVVVGGAGRMGRWMCRFLSAQGYETGALDPAAEREENEWASRALASAELVVCSTPPTATAQLYASWEESPPTGVVFDIASIKTPLIGAIAALQRSGGRVASIHPMFGPSAVLLRGADVVICDTGDAAATEAVERLFQPTSARLVPMPLADHDRVMADLMSLAHGTAIAFALALPREEHPVRSTTFRALESLASAVVRESPEVYFEIQTGNPHSADSLARLAGALARLVEVLSSGEPERFRALFSEGQLRAPSVTRNEV